MFQWGLVKRVAPWVLLAASILGTVWYIYDAGVDSGSRQVQAKWDDEKTTYKKAMDTLRDQYATLEAKARIDNQRNSDELAEKEKTHAVALVELRREYDGRLLQSDKRASYYQRLAKGGAVEQANLASHAARLDRSLEEGRRMVAELSATLRQRDDQLRAVSKQLENDRSLFMTGDKK